MDLSSNKSDSPRDAQISAAFSLLQDAMAAHIEDLNKRLNAGLAVRRTQTTLEVHEFEKADAVVSVSLSGESIEYRNIIKRSNEMESGTIDVGTCHDHSPALMFQDVAHAKVQVSYREASKRLIDSSF